MKKIAKFLIVLGMMGQLSSCDYLDIVPDERAQESGYLEDGRCGKRISLFLLWLFTS